MYNKTVLIGNVVTDPETKYTSSGTAICTIRVAIDDPFREKNPIFIDVEAWEKTAEFSSKWLKKGSSIIVDGRLCMDTWEKDGKKNSKLYIRAQDIRFANSSKGDSKSQKPQESKQETKVKKQTASAVSAIEETEDVPF